MIPECDVWAVIHKIDDAAKKDDLQNMSRQKLCRYAWRNSYVMEKIKEIAAYCPRT